MCRTVINDVTVIMLTLISAPQLITAKHNIKYYEHSNRYCPLTKSLLWRVKSLEISHTIVTLRDELCGHLVNDWLFKLI